MRRKIACVLCVMVLFCVSACGNSKSDGELEALRSQVNELESRLSEMTASTESSSAKESGQASAEGSSAKESGQASAESSSAKESEPATHKDSNIAAFRVVVHSKDKADYIFENTEVVAGEGKFCMAYFSTGLGSAYAVGLYNDGSSNFLTCRFQYLDYLEEMSAYFISSEKSEYVLPPDQYVCDYRYENNDLIISLDTKGNFNLESVTAYTVFNGPREIARMEVNASDVTDYD